MHSASAHDGTEADMKKLIKRRWMKYKEGCTVAHLHDQKAAQRAVTDPRIVARIALDIEETREELAAIRAAYLATFAPGVRRTWTFA